MLGREGATPLSTSPQAPHGPAEAPRGKRGLDPEPVSSRQSSHGSEDKEGAAGVSSPDSPSVLTNLFLEKKDFSGNHVSLGRGPSAGPDTWLPFTSGPGVADAAAVCHVGVWWMAHSEDRRGDLPRGRAPSPRVQLLLSASCTDRKP